MDEITFEGCVFEFCFDYCLYATVDMATVIPRPSFHPAVLNKMV